MTSSMVLSAVPSTTASAAAANPLGLQLTSEKTSFSLDEIKAGQSATVYVDATGPISESDKVGSVEFKLKSSAWGKVDPVDLYLCDPNVLETSKGSQPKKAYNATGTMVISKWEGTKPSKVGYALQDYSAVDSFPGSYSDDYCPSVILISDSTKGFLRTGSEGQHIAQFNVNFPKDLAEGTYTISFEDAKSMICVDGEFGSNNSEMAASPAAKAITFTIGSGQGPATSEPSITTPVPTPGSEVVISENPVIKDSDKKYDADATLKGGIVKAKAGEKVDVPVYLELGANADPKYITGIGFKVEYDKSALELADMSDGEGFVSDGGFNADAGTGVFLYTFTTEDIQIDPTKPIGTLTFNVKSGVADGTYRVHLTNHLNGDSSAVQIIHTQRAREDATYFVPHVTDGAVVVGEGGNVTPVETTVDPSKIDGNRIYDGDATLKGDTVKAKAGETVNVPVYLELGSNVDPKYITGIGFKAVYDTSALELTDISDGDGFISDGGFNSDTGTGVFLFTFTTEDIQVDPTKPIATFTFKVSGNASGTYPVKFVNHLFGEQANIQIVHTQYPQKEATYLKPTVINGAVVIDGGTAGESTKNPADENRIYDGDANLKVDTVKANAGETVDVPVYLELGANVDPKYITGIGFKVVYDKSALELVDMSDSDGFLSDGGFNSDTETGVFLYTFTTEDIEIDPTKPIGILTFKVKDGTANGTYKVELINHLFEGANIQIIHTQYPQKDATYLTPHLTNGAVIVGDTVITTSEPQPVPGTTASSTKDPDENRIYDGDAYLKGETVKGSRGAEVKVPVYLELGANVDPKYITGIGFKVVYDKNALELVDISDGDGFISDGGFNADTETGVFLYTFTTEDIEIDATKPIGYFTFKVKDTAADGTYPVEFINHLFGPTAKIQIIHTQYPQKEATYLTPHVTNGAVIIGEGSTTPEPGPITSETTTTEFVAPPVESTTPNQPGPVQTEIVTSIVTVYVPDPNQPAQTIVSISEVTVPYIITETVTVLVPVPSESSTTPTPGPQPTGKVSISIVDNENHWYFADEDSWNLSQVKVFVDGNETNVSAADLKFSVGGNSGATPSNTYQKGTFDYKVTVSYQDATAEFTAKIGQRGDANCDHDVNVRDAAAIAKDLASLIKNNNKTALTKEGGFGVFLGNADGGKGGKEAYAPYDLTVRDAAVIAKFLSQKVAHPEQTLKDLAVK